MSKTKKVILTIVAVIFGLLVLANSFFLYILIGAYKQEHTNIDMRDSTYMSVLLNNDKDMLATDSFKQIVKDILADDPYILRNEPVIFLANPDLKPVVANVLADNPDILEKDIDVVAQYPELLEMDAGLENAVKSILESPEYDGSHQRVEKLFI